MMNNNITLLICIFPFWLWRSYVLVKLWLWFIVPTGLPPLAFATALGIALIVGLLTPNKINKDPVTLEAIITAVLVAFITPLVGLVTGWCIHLCM